MCTASLSWWPSTTWSLVAVLLALTIVDQTTAQLNVFLSQDDAKSYIKMDFPRNLYLMEGGVPVTLVQNPGAFYRFMSPIQPSVLDLRLNWFSTPQASHYRMVLNSSDTKMMHNPIVSIPLEGIVEQSTTAFVVSFECTGKKEGEADMTFSLHYTTIGSGIVNSNNSKTFDIVVRRRCLKTIGEDDGNEDDEIPPEQELSSSPWSRRMVVGLCAGLTLVIILIVGLIVLCRYNMRKRKLKMEFEDDLEMYRSSSSKIYKKSEDEESGQLGDSKPGLIYNPPQCQFSYPEGHGLVNTNDSDSATVGLVTPEDKLDSPTPKQPNSNRDAKHRTKHKKYERPFKGDTKLGWIPDRPSSFHETESLLERRNTPDEAQNTEGLFSVLNEFWSRELADILLSRDQVSLKEPLKRGTFGYLYKGTVRGLDEEQPRRKCDVSIKALQDEADMDTITLFVQEAMVIKDLQHPNVVKLVGVALQRAAPPYIITPLTKNGDLGHFLKISRATSARPQILTSCQLINFGIQICCGMDFVAKNQIVNRNLAAANCIVEDDLTVKITDFSLAQDVNATGLSDKGIQSRLLIKWTAPESLKHGHFTEKSDVWSFGVVLWELVTLAKAPYQAIDSSKIEQHLQAGYRLPQPSNCPYDLYLLMKNCWESSPVERPTFNLLTKQLEHYAGRLAPDGGVKFEYLPESNC